MEVRPSESAIETKERHWSKALSPMEITPSGTATWPFASGVYRQPWVATGDDEGHVHEILLVQLVLGLGSGHWYVLVVLI